MLTCWRHPDRERGWQRLRSAWPDVVAEPGDYDARGADGVAPVLKPASLTRLEVAEMEEAFGWLDRVKPVDRKLVGLAVAQLARGHQVVQWRRLLAPMGVRHGADGLRKRYGRALTGICARLNARTSAVESGSTPIICTDSD